MSGMFDFPTFEMTEEEIPPYEMTDEEIAEVFFKILIYVFGVIGNLLVIFVIVFLNEYKKITHWYVLQMAIADIIFLHNLPFKVTEDINGRWIHSAGLCSSQQTVLFLTYYASILFLTIMAIDRYLAVCHPMSNTVQRIRTNRNAYIVALVTWIVSLCMSIPAMLYSDISGNHPYCKCTLQFPQIKESPEDWCIRNELDKPFPVGSGLGGSGLEGSGLVNSGLEGSGLESSGFEGGGLETCINELYPQVHPSEDSCIVTDTGGSGFPFGDDDLSSGFTETSGEGYLLAGCTHDEKRPGWMIFIYFNFVAMFVIPLLVIVTCYSLIVRKLLTSTLSRDSSNEGGKIHNSNRKRASTGKSDKEKTKVTILCALLALLFTIFWLPFHSAHIARIFGIATTDSAFCGRLSAATSILAYLSSATNPYLYNFLGSFKKRMEQIKESNRMQSLLAGTGLTRETRTRSSGAASTSDGSRARTSAAPTGEAIPLNIIDVQE